MARLPNPGGDTNTWGDILNDFLAQEHNADGSQKLLAQSKIINLSSDLASKADDSTIVHNTGAETIGGAKTFSNSPVVPTPASGTDAANKTYVDSQISGGVTPDATSTLKGKLQLAGDLSGTAAAPTVPALATKVNTSRTLIAGTGLTGGGDLSADRTLAIDGTVVTLTGTQTLTNKILTSPAITAPTGIVKSDVGLGNVDNTSDANKPVSTAQATALAVKADTTDPRLSDARTPTGSAGGVLTGTYPNPSFTVDMATQTELDAETTARASADTLLIPKSFIDAKGDLITATANDTPARLVVGTDGQVLTANSAAGTGVVWATPAATSTITENLQTTDYTLVLGDGGKSVTMNSASPRVITIPLNSAVAFPVGTAVELCRYGVGSLTITPSAGVTTPNRVQIAGTASRTIATQMSSASIRKRGTDEWVLVGDIS